MGEVKPLGAQSPPNPSGTLLAKFAKPTIHFTLTQEDETCLSFYDAHSGLMRAIARAHPLIERASERVD